MCLLELLCSTNLLTHSLENVAVSLQNHTSYAYSFLIPVPHTCSSYMYLFLKPVPHTCTSYPYLIPVPHTCCFLSLCAVPGQPPPATGYGPPPASYPTQQPPGQAYGAPPPTGYPQQPPPAGEATFLMNIQRSTVYAYY